MLCAYSTGCGRVCFMGSAYCKKHMLFIRNLKRKLRGNKPRKLRGVSVDDWKKYEAEERRVVAMYKGGKSLRRVAKFFRCSVSRVSDILERQHAELRGPGRPAGRKTK